MKRKAALILVLCILAMSISACKEKAGSNAGNPTGSQAEATPTEAISTEVTPTETVSEEGISGFETVTLEIDDEKNFEGLLIEDKDEFRISIDGIQKAFLYPQAVVFSYENKTDHHLAVAVSALSVNGCALGCQVANLWEKEDGSFAILYPEELQAKYAANGIKTVRFMLTAYYTGDTDVAEPDAQEAAFYKKLITIQVKDAQENEIVNDTENLVSVIDDEYLSVRYRLQEENNRTIYVVNKLTRPIYIDFSDVCYIPSYSEYPVESRISFYDQRNYWNTIEQGVKMHHGSLMILPGECTELKMEVIDAASTEIKDVSYCMKFLYADTLLADTFFNAFQAVRFGEKLCEVNIEE